MITLPGSTTRDQLRTAIRKTTGRPDLLIDEAECKAIGHRITSPVTQSLTRVKIRAHDDAPLELALVAKCLQPALRGLPPVIPAVERERIAAGIPWRLEAEIYTGATAELMPPGLRLPKLFAAIEQPDERITLWMEDIDATDGPWSADDLRRAAVGLGRLTATRACQQLQTMPPKSFLRHMVDNSVTRWSVPAIRSSELWEHPAFAQAPVAALRDPLRGLAEEIELLYGSLSAVPWLNTHGDATPMNLLRPRDEPGAFVLIDWGTASVGPTGWDIVPLIFGPAENGTAPPDDLADRLAIAVDGYENGLALEAKPPEAGAVARVVRTAALLRYAFTSLPIGDTMSGAPVDDALLSRALDKAAFVESVLRVCG